MAAKKRKKAYDFTRMEKEPPRVSAPYSIVRGGPTPFMLMKDGFVLKACFSASLDGAHREALLFIKNDMDF